MNKSTLIKTLQMENKKRGADLSLQDLPSPKLFPNLILAVKTIIDRLSTGKKMLIVGDYDADGVLATAILYDFLCEAGFKESVEFYIPERFINGYSVSTTIVDFAFSNKFSFIVTVDNGIGAYDAVEYANSLGIEVIVTDHHEPGEKIPNALILVDLKYDRGDFPFVDISGATVAWYLVYQLCEELDCNIDVRKWLDYVAITIISDVMPLKNINLPLYKYGFNLIKNRHRPVYSLFFDDRKNRTLNETSLGFLMVPMINASGRLAHAKIAADLFLSKDLGEMKQLYGKLVDINNERKTLTDAQTALIMPQAKEQFEKGHKAIIVKHKFIHEGIVGILAGRIAEKFKVPTYVLTWSEAKQSWKGSGRTAGSVNLHALTQNAKQHTTNFGGHAGAVGVAIEDKKLKSFQSIIKRQAKKYSDNERTTTDADALRINMPLNEINLEFLDILEQLRPFGEGFRAPILETNAHVNVVTSYKNNLHWKCNIFDDSTNKGFESFFFHNKEIEKINGSSVMIRYFPTLEEIQGGRKILLHCNIAS